MRWESRRFDQVTRTFRHSIPDFYRGGKSVKLILVSKDRLATLSRVQVNSLWAFDPHKIWYSSVYARTDPDKIAPEINSGGGDLLSHLNNSAAKCRILV